MTASAGLERGPLSLASTTVELLERKRSGSGIEIEITTIGDPPRWLRDTILSANVGINFAEKWQLLGRYSLLADSGHRVFIAYLTTLKSHLLGCSVQ
jgi:hypothetical protein